MVTQRSSHEYPDSYELDTLTRSFLGTEYNTKPFRHVHAPAIVGMLCHVFGRTNRAAQHSTPSRNVNSSLLAEILRFRSLRAMALARLLCLACLAALLCRAPRLFAGQASSPRRTLQPARVMELSNPDFFMGQACAGLFVCFSCFFSSLNSKMKQINSTRW